MTGGAAPPDPARPMALAVLEAVSLKGKPLEETFFRLATQRKLDNRDSALARELVYGVLRWQGRLDHILSAHLNRPLDKLNPRVLLLLRMGAHQILNLDRIPNRAAVHSAVNLARRGLPGWAPGLVNAVLRAVGEERKPVVWPDAITDPAANLAARRSHPHWLVAQWLERFGPRADELLKADNLPPEPCLRVNTLTGDRRTLVTDLKELGLAARPGEYSPQAVILPRARLDELTARMPGRFTAQAEASQLVAPEAAPEPGMRVLDMCAGAGGKTGHLIELMGGRGSVVAVDPDRGRLATARKRLTGPGRDAPGLKLELVQADGREELPRGLDTRPFEIVLLDAPCSGLGVLRARPDRRWRVSREDPARLARLQVQLALAAADRLAPDGLLVYATCTLTGEENGEVVRKLLDRRPDLKVEPPVGPGRRLVNRDGFIVTLPHEHGLDGFFIARLRKR